MAKREVGTTTVSVEVELALTAYVAPGDPGCRTMRNGDPGWPPSGPDVDDEQIHLSKEQAAAFAKLAAKHGIAFTAEVVEEIMRALVGEQAWDDILVDAHEAIIMDAAESSGPE